MKLVLIRHSEPDPGRDAFDPPLTEAGRRLAAATGQWLVGEDITAVYSSSSRRARETAELIAEQIGAPVIERDGLTEFNADQEYLTVDELRRSADARWAAMAAGDLAIFGTDTETFRAEVAAAIGAIVDAHPGQTVAVVAHAGVRSVLSLNERPHACGLPSGGS